MQGPKALGRPQLLSRATGRELEGKRGCRDRTSSHMGSRACKARTLTTAPPRRAQAQEFFLMELIDIVLSKQYVKNNASSIFQNTWVETVLITGSKKNYRLK